MTTYKNMSTLWNYLVDILEDVPNEYKLGKFGQKANGKCQYDCVCLIKSFPWCNGKAGSTPQYKANNIADDWLGNLYVYADKKSDKMSELPKEGIWLVYLNNEHIAVYNAATGTTIECCAGNTMKVVERDLHHYDGSKYQWNKWSDLYWCPQGETNTRSTIRKTNNTTPDINIYDGEFERVQIGSFTVKDNAVRRAKEVKSQGFDVIIKKYNEYYRVQVGAYSVHSNAVNMLNKMKNLGYSDAYITTEGGEDVTF